MAAISEARARALSEAYRIRRFPGLAGLNRYYLTAREAEDAARAEVKRGGDPVHIEQLRFLRVVAEVAAVRRDFEGRIWTDVSQFQDALL